MSLITTSNLNILLQTIKKLLSFKADKSEVVFRNEVEEEDALELSVEMGLVSPTAAEDGAIYTDENGVLYAL